MWLSTLRKFNNCHFLHFLCICPKDFYQRADCGYFVDYTFEYKFKSKYILYKWEGADYYENFLYLDNDILCQGNIDEIFDLIQENPSKIHGVTEFDHLEDVPLHNMGYARFTNSITHPKSPSYNAGSFGFNRQMLPRFYDYLNFTYSNQHKAICDQPIFNEFFIERSSITPSLNPFVKLLLDTGDAKDSTEPLLHYNGYYGEANPKLERMINKYNRIMQL